MCYVAGIWEKATDMYTIETQGAISGSQSQLRLKERHFLLIPANSALYQKSSYLEAKTHLSLPSKEANRNQCLGQESASDLLDLE